MISWKSIGAMSRWAQSGIDMCSHFRKAFNRNSNIQSGSPLISQIRRTMSSLRPFGKLSDSISVVNPYSYSWSSTASSSAFWPALRAVVVRPAPPPAPCACHFARRRCTGARDARTPRVERTKPSAAKPAGVMPRNAHVAAALLCAGRGMASGAPRAGARVGTGRSEAAAVWKAGGARPAADDAAMALRTPRERGRPGSSRGAPYAARIAAATVAPRLEHEHS
mmetsp:Transcript_36917/g.102513  ORF Transcript_36917/g.102513 Transcript_36917/m.102513 type:complete len:223 (+) Transcript_36917:1379-2047(+)